MIKKEILIGIVIILLVGSFASGVKIEYATQQSIRGDILYVGGSEPGNYSSIQAAINDANPGDTVFVYDDSAPYYENVIVNKSIYLIGEDRDTTIIDGSGIGNTINITENSVFISGFTIQNSLKNGICLVWGNNCTISGNNVYGGYFGIRLESGKNHLIHDCNFYDNIMNGVFIGNDFGPSVKNNVITYCYFNNSTIHFLRSANNTIHNNTFISGGISFGYGYFEQNIDTTNTVNGKPVYYFLDEKDMIIDNWEIGQLILVNCTDFSIKNNKISETSLAIIAANSTNNTITNCEFNHNRGGIIFYNSLYNTIEDNSICNTSFQSTQFGGWPSCGIGITGSYNIIRNNNISTYEIGIWVLNYFYLYFITENNIIQGNNLYSNYLCGVGLTNSSSNQVYHNNFIENTQNANDNGTNTWDNGKKGNYWDDYEEKYPDARKIWWKGIWDTPYEIPGGDNEDMYPLIKEWSGSLSKTKQNNKTINRPFLNSLQSHPNTFKLIQLLFQRLGLQ
jgi:parallel beta-helix repeat protein